MSTLALLVAASLLSIHGPTDRTSAQKDYLLKAVVDWAAPILSSNGTVAGKAARGDLLLGYSAFVYGAHEDVPALFPATYLGGTPSEWGARSRDGLHVSFDRPHRWEAVQLYGEPEVLEPPELLALAHGGPPATVTDMVYREDQPQISGPGLCLWPPYPGGCTRYAFGPIELIDLDLVDLDTAWTATVTVEFYCVYKNTEGQVTGVLTSADVGLPTDTDVLSIDFIPVPASTTTWGTLKARFATP